MEEQAGDVFGWNTGRHELVIRRGVFEELFYGAVCCVKGPAPGEGSIELYFRVCRGASVKCWRSVVLCDLDVLEQFWYLVKDLLLKVHQGGVILELVAEDLVDMAGQASVDKLEGPEDENVFKGG